MLPEFPEWNLSWQWMAHDVICVDWPKRSRCPTMKQQTLQNCLVKWSVSACAAFYGFHVSLSEEICHWLSLADTCWYSFERSVSERLLICSLLFQVKLCDFGTAIEQKDISVTRVHTVSIRIRLATKGTGCLYVWALACTFYEIFTGKTLLQVSQQVLALCIAVGWSRCKLYCI